MSRRCRVWPKGLNKHTLQAIANKARVRPWVHRAAAPFNAARAGQAGTACLSRKGGREARAGQVQGPARWVPPL